MDLARIAFDQAWQLTALAVVVWLTTRIVARNRPHLAYVLWLVVLLKAITPPVWSSPTGIFSWVQASLSSEAVDVSVLQADPNPLTFYPEIQRAPAPYETVYAPAINEQAATRLTAVPLNPKSSRATTQSVRRGLAIIWFSGLLVALLVTVTRWTRCVWMLRHAPAVDRPDLAKLVSKLSRQLQVRRRVGLLVTTSRIGPAVLGLFRPLIVLPEIIVKNKRADELEAIIAHELLHVRRGDLWLGLLQVGAEAVWWFHPLVWWAGRMSTREAERCCDEEVIGELRCDPKRYARSLLEVLELKRRLTTVPACPGMKPVEVTSQRLERIMKLGQGCHKRTPRWCWAVMLLFAAGALPGAAFVLATDESDVASLRTTEKFHVVAPEAGEWAADSPVIDISVEILRAPQQVVDASIQGWKWDGLHLSEQVADDGASRELPLPNRDASPKTASGRVIETRLPALYKVLDDQQASAMKQLILKERRTSKLAIPRVAVFSGQSASIMDAVQRPYVVGLQADDEPQVRVVTEGTTLQVRPSLYDNGRIGLAYALGLTRILDVRETTFSLEGRKNPLTFQVPEVETTSVESSLSFASGQTLVIGGLTTADKKGRKQAMLVMLKATERPAENRTSRLTFGTGVNSDVGVTGAIVVDERSFESDGILRERLGRRITVDLSEVTLRSAIQHISEQIEVPIEINEKELAAEGVTPELAVTLVFDKTSADVALRSLLESHDLRYSIEDRTVVIRGKSSEPTFAVCYNVADLLKMDLECLNQPEVEAGDYSSQGLRSLATLVASLIERVAPSSWVEDGGSCVVEPYPANQSLVILQTAEGHQKVAGFLRHTRKRLGMRVEHDEAPSKLLRTEEARSVTTPSTRVYAVADLVIPVPSALRTPEELPRNGKIQEGAVADFDSLIDLITSTIEPQSWGHAGGGGRIESFPTNLSLVVTQSVEVHEQITDLLVQLRRLQDLQITIEAKFISVPKSFFAPGELPGFDVVDFPAGDVAIEIEAGKPVLLSDIEAFFLQQAIQQSDDSKLLAAPKITLFNGQQARVSTEQNGAVKSTLQFEAVCSADRRAVHLRVATDADTEINSLPLEMITSGASILLRLDDSAAAAWSVTEDEVQGVSFLENIPYVARLFKNTPRPVERIAMLLVTPQVIVAEEEEELLIVQPGGSD